MRARKCGHRGGAAPRSAPASPRDRIWPRAELTNDVPSSGQRKQKSTRATWEATGFPWGQVCLSSLRLLLLLFKHLHYFAERHAKIDTFGRSLNKAQIPPPPPQAECLPSPGRSCRGGGCSNWPLPMPGIAIDQIVCFAAAESESGAGCGHRRLRSPRMRRDETRSLFTSFFRFAFYSLARGRLQGKNVFALVV